MIINAIERIFRILDIDCESIVEVRSRKDLLDYMDEYLDNMSHDWFDPTNDSFAILYKDGTHDYIDSCYDGHKIKRQHIASMVYTNVCTSIVYGNFEMNRYGVVTPSDVEIIAEENIVEIFEK